jgi:predicted nucleic acid-binding protein
MRQLLLTPPSLDLPDRIIAATALFHGVPVLSRDGRIRGSNIKTIW